jgi:hypothetical protein
MQGKFFEDELTGVVQEGTGVKAGIAKQPCQGIQNKYWIEK